MKSRNDEMKIQWWKFHKEHPEVYTMFKHFTFEMIRGGAEHGSAMMVIQRIRWETHVIENRGNDFKVNNNHAPWYARLFMYDHPQHEGFFRVRRMPSKDAPETGLPPLQPRDFDEPAAAGQDGS